MSLPTQERYEFMTTVQPGDILLVQRRHPVSDVIRHVTRSAWSHVAMFGLAAGWVPIVIEATLERGVAATKIETVIDDPILSGLQIMRPRDWGGLPGPEVSRARLDVQAAMWQQTGCPYDNAINLRILFHIANHIPTDSFQCAAAVANAYRRTWGDVIDITCPTPEAFDQAAEIFVEPTEGGVNGPVRPPRLAVVGPARLARIWRWLLPDPPALAAQAAAYPQAA